MENDFGWFFSEDGKTLYCYIDNKFEPITDPEEIKKRFPHWTPEEYASKNNEWKTRPVADCLPQDFKVYPDPTRHVIE
jgi:hypothetical protein